MSSFGSFYRITTFGESHCKAVGVIIDGVPAGLAITESDIQPFLDRRRPGQSDLTTPVTLVYKNREMKKIQFLSCRALKWDLL